MVGWVEPTVGIILAGGLAKRMGGGDKLLLRADEVPILARLVACLRPQCDDLLLNANGDPGRFAEFGLAVVPDDVEGHPGPLAGIVVGLDHIAHERPGCRWALTMPGDTPFPPDDLVERLHEVRACEGAEVAMAASGGRVHPAIALWPVASRGDMRKFLVQEGQRRDGGFAERYRVARVDWPIDPYDPFLNVNTPGDLAMADAVALRRGMVSPIKTPASASGT